VEIHREEGEELVTANATPGIRTVFSRT